MSGAPAVGAVHPPVALVVVREGEQGPGPFRHVLTGASRRVHDRARHHLRGEHEIVRGDSLAEAAGGYRLAEHGLNLMPKGDRTLVTRVGVDHLDERGRDDHLPGDGREQSTYVGALE